MSRRSLLGWASRNAAKPKAEAFDPFDIDAAAAKMAAELEAASAASGYSTEPAYELYVPHINGGDVITCLDPWNYAAAMRHGFMPNSRAYRGARSQFKADHERVGCTYAGQTLTEAEADAYMKSGTLHRADLKRIRAAA